MPRKNRQLIRTAIALFDDPTLGLTAYQAGKQAGLKSLAPLYRALDARERPNWPSCPTCGKKTRPGAILCAPGPTPDDYSDLM